MSDSKLPNSDDLQALREKGIVWTSPACRALLAAAAGVGAALLMAPPFVARVHGWLNRTAGPEGSLNTESALAEGIALAAWPIIVLGSVTLFVILFLGLAQTKGYVGTPFRGRKGRIGRGWAILGRTCLSLAAFGAATVMITRLRPTDGASVLEFVKSLAGTLVAACILGAAIGLVPSRLLFLYRHRKRGTHSHE